VLGELGDDPNRHTTAKWRENHAGTSTDGFTAPSTNGLSARSSRRSCLLRPAPRCRRRRPPRLTRP